MVCSELSARRPIYYIGADKEYAGHAFVLDGYDRNGMVHVDWGWSGTSNGYFDIATLQPYELGVGSGSGTGYAFAQLMSVGLVPATVESEPKSLLGGMEEFIVEGDSVFIAFVMNQGGTFNGNMAIIAERDGVQTVMSELQPMEELYPFDILRGIRLELFYPSAAGTYRVYFGAVRTGNLRGQEPEAMDSGPKNMSLPCTKTARTRLWPQKTVTPCRRSGSCHATGTSMPIAMRISMCPFPIRWQRITLSGLYTFISRLKTAKDLFWQFRESFLSPDRKAFKP